MKLDPTLADKLEALLKVSGVSVEAIDAAIKRCEADGYDAIAIEMPKIFLFGIELRFNGVGAPVVLGSKERPDLGDEYYGSGAEFAKYPIEKT